MPHTAAAHARMAACGPARRMHACMQVAKDEALNQPQLNVVTSTVNFDAIDLTIHSRAADWLYQSVMSLFRGARAKEQPAARWCSMHQSS